MLFGFWRPYIFLHFYWKCFYYSCGIYQSSYLFHSWGLQKSTTEGGASGFIQWNSFQNRKRWHIIRVKEYKRLTRETINYHWLEFHRVYITLSTTRKSWTTSPKSTITNMYDSFILLAIGFVCLWILKRKGMMLIP